MRGRGGGGVYYQRHGALKYGILQSFNPSVNNFPDTDKILEYERKNIVEMLNK